MNSKTVVNQFASLDELIKATADLVLEAAAKAAASRGRFDFVLSGGSTPAPLYRLLAQSPYARTMPWNLTHFFWGDERIVPPEDKESNYGQVRRILLDPIQIKGENVHPIKGELTPSEAAKKYSDRLSALWRERKANPLFDLVLLGLGGDGHTASLFPGSADMYEKQALATTATAEYGGRPAHRVTLTPLAFNQSRQIVFLVTGEAKAIAVENAINGPFDPLHIPSHRIRPETGMIYWMLDEAAASRL